MTTTVPPFVTDSYDGQTRKVTLSGDPRAVTMAREMIDDILREFQQNDQSKSQGFMVRPI
jgi:hypothetical protein